MMGASVVEDAMTSPPQFTFKPMPYPGSRTLLADRIVRAGSDIEAIGVVCDTNIDVTRRIVLIGADAEAAGRHLGPAASEVPAEGSGAPGTARVVKDTGNAVTVEAEASRPAILFLADCWFPLFRARVDGADAPLWRANYAYRGVPIPAGRHTVEISYVPLDLYAGLGLTLLAIAALCVIVIVLRRRAAANLASRQRE
jgi:hypothetical protein